MSDETTEINAIDTKIAERKITYSQLKTTDEKVDFIAAMLGVK